MANCLFWRSVLSPDNDELAREEKKLVERLKTVRQALDLSPEARSASIAAIMLAIADIANEPPPHHETPPKGKPTSRRRSGLKFI